MATESVAIIGLESNSPKPGRLRDGLELAIGYSLILLVIWTPRPWQRVLYSVAAIFLVVVTWRSFESVRAMGLRTTNLLRSAWVVVVALLLAGVALLLSAHLHTLHRGDVNHGVVAFLKRYWGYALWAFAQQILLQDFFLRRMLRLVSHAGPAVLVAAGIFSLAHLPNPILTVVTFFGGLAACAIFLRYRNLYPLGLAHAVLGITIAIAVPGPMIRNMRVGLGYLTYAHQHPGRHHDLQRSHADQTVSTRACVKAEAPTRRS
jgi:membrane protease YdiL (CAAX protease family)